MVLDLSLPLWSWTGFILNGLVGLLFPTQAWPEMEVVEGGNDQAQYNEEDRETG